MRPTFSVKFRITGAPGQEDLYRCYNVTPLKGEQLTRDDYERAANEVVRHRRLLAPRSDPMSVKVACFLQVLDAGQVKDRLGPVFDINLPLAPRTDVEFETDMNALLEPLPPEFRRFVWDLAWEHGHASGHDEVFNQARELYSNLLTAVSAYERRTAAEREAVGRKPHGRST
jgi:hypothetical protein